MAQLGPVQERIEYESGEERTTARVLFYRIVNGGHGVHSWQSASMLYWHAVKDDLTD